MTEHGLVIDTDSGIAKVSLDRSANCEECSACCIGKDRSMIAEVGNSVNARKGDRVIVEINDSQSVKAVLIALGLPLLVLIVGAIVFSNLAQNMGFGNSGEIIGGIAGFLLMALSFVVIRRYDRRIEKRQNGNMKIVDIVRSNQLNL